MLSLKNIARLSIIIFGLLGIVFNFVTAGNHPTFPELGNFNSFLYFTIQSNLIVILWFINAIICDVRKKHNNLTKPVFKGAITSYISLTFIVYVTILEPIYHPTGIQFVASILLHYVVPILVILDWVIYEEKRTYRHKFLILWLIYPFTYMIYGLIIAIIFDKFLYPFFNINQLKWFIIPVLIVLTIVYIIIASTLIIFNQRMHPRKKV